MERKSIAERLAEKIRKDTAIICDPASFRRTYAGKNQRAVGAYVWMMQAKDSYFVLGSCWPATECVKKKNKLFLGAYGEIIPEERNSL